METDEHTRTELAARFLRRRDYISALLDRDPEFRRLLRVKDIVASPNVPEWVRSRIAETEDLVTRFRAVGQKYNLPSGLLIPQGYSPFFVEDEGWESWFPAVAIRNWKAGGPPISLSNLSVKVGRGLIVGSTPLGVAMLSLPPPPVLLVAIDLSLLTTNDASLLGRWFRTLLVRDLAESRRAAPARKIPELDFLRRIRPSVFRRDLARFDLHMRDGLSFRQIALTESGASKDKLQLSIAGPVRGESNVEKSVKKIFRAIFRRTYSVRRRSLDADAALKVEPFTCPDHSGGSCPPSCAYAARWMDRLNKVLPTDTTGRFPGEIPEREPQPRDDE